MVLTTTAQYRQALVQLSISAAADRNAEIAPDGADVTCGASARSMPAIATTACDPCRDTRASRGLRHLWLGARQNSSLRKRQGGGVGLLPSLVAPAFGELSGA